MMSFSEKDNEIKEIIKNFNQQTLIFQETESQKDESNNDAIYLQNKNRNCKLSNLISFIKENEHDENRLEKKPNKFLVIKEEPKKPRGRKRKTETNNVKHSQNAFDNIESKIQVHYINFIKNLVNDIIEFELKTKKDFYFENIDYNFKKRFLMNIFKILKNLKLKIYYNI